MIRRSVGQTVDQEGLDRLQRYVEWFRKNSHGYWIKGDGVLSYALYRPSWWERLWKAVLWDETFVPNKKRRT